MDWRTEIVSYIWAVINNWAGYLTGGIAVALIAVRSWLQPAWKPSRRFALMLVSFFLFLSSFQAWKEQFEKAHTLEARLNAKPIQPTINVNVPPIQVLPPSASDRQLDPVATMMARKMDLKKQLIALADELMGYSIKWGMNGPRAKNMADANIDQTKEPERWEAERLRRSDDHEKKLEAYNASMVADYRKRYKAKVDRVCAESRELGADIGGADTVIVDNEGGPYTISRLLRDAAHQL